MDMVYRFGLVNIHIYIYIYIYIYIFFNNNNNNKNKMEQNMKDNGIKIKLLEKENLLIQMAMYMRVNGKMIKRMVMGAIFM